MAVRHRQFFLSCSRKTHFYKKKTDSERENGKEGTGDRGRLSRELIGGRGEPAGRGTQPQRQGAQKMEHHL